MAERLAFPPLLVKKRYLLYNFSMGKYFITISIILISTLSVLSYEGSYYNRPTSNQQVQNDFADYMVNLQNKLNKNWIAPDFMPEGHIRVLFKIDREGNVISGDILESSGNRLYDESAVEAIHKSEPFGKFPNNSTREILTVNYCFDTSLINVDNIKYYVSMADKSFREDKKKALELVETRDNCLNDGFIKGFQYVLHSFLFYNPER